MGSRADQTNEEIYKRVRPHLQGRRTAVDCGAYHGEWTRLLRQDFQEVVAFEIREESYRVLAANLPGGCRAQNLGLGRACEIRRFALHHGEYLQIERAEHYPDKPRFDLEVHPLDEFALKNVDFIKLDVDGMEADVIHGAMETIAHYQPVMCVEIKLMKPDVRAMLLDFLGYRCECRVSWIDEVWVPQ